MFLKRLPTKTGSLFCVQLTLKVVSFCGGGDRLSVTLTRKQVLIADGAMLFAAVFWGSGFAVTSWLLDYMSPLWLLTVRFLASGGILMCFLWNRVKKLRRKHVVLGILLGGVLAATFIAHVVGLLYTTPGKQSFIAGSNVVMVPFLYALFYKRLPSLLATLGAFVTTVGLLVMAFTPGMSFNLGDGLSLLLAVGIAFHVLLVGNLSRRMDPVALTVVQLFASGVFLLTLSLVLEPIPHFGDVSPKVWWGIGYIVAFVTVIPFFIQTVAQRYSPETHAAIILSMESPFGYIIAIALGEEMLNLQIVLGGALILAGVFLAELEIFLERRK